MKQLIQLKASWCRLYTEEEKKYERAMGNEDDCDPINRETGIVIVDLDWISVFNPIDDDEKTSVRFKDGFAIQIDMPFKKFVSLMKHMGFAINENSYL